MGSTTANVDTPPLFAAGNPIHQEKIFYKQFLLVSSKTTMEMGAFL
jgi:hypothetical protein